jgi:hypothetical protein
METSYGKLFMKTTVFWNMKPQTNRRFGGTRSIFSRNMETSPTDASENIWTTMRSYITYYCFLRYRCSNLKCTFPGSIVRVIVLAIMRSLRTEDIRVGKLAHDGIWWNAGGRIKMMFTFQGRQVDVVSFRDPAWILGAFL